MEAILVIFVFFSLICCPLMFYSSVNNIWINRAWWWNQKEGKDARTIDRIFLIIPLLVGLHWSIVGIYFPTLYK